MPEPMRAEEWCDLLMLRVGVTANAVRDGAKQAERVKVRSVWALSAAMVAGRASPKSCCGCGPPAPVAVWLCLALP